MLPRRAGLLVAALVALSWATAAALPCPPFGFEKRLKQNFDLSKFTTGSWHLQLQFDNAQQPQDTMYCVRVEYRPVDRSNLTKGIELVNYSNKGAVNGPVVDPLAAGGGLMLFPAPKSFAAGAHSPNKLVVGPKAQGGAFVAGKARSHFSPYWVVAAGDSTNPAWGYDWVVVALGPPVVPTLRGTCRAAEPLRAPPAGRGSGLWILTRKTTDPSGLLAAMEAAAALGYDTNDMRGVDHNGCVYDTPSGGSAKGVAAASVAVPRGKVSASSLVRVASTGMPQWTTPVKTPAKAPAHAGGAALEAGAAAKAAPKSSLTAVTKQVYMDLEQGGEDLGRVVLGLYGNAAPGTVDNFVALALGKTPGGVSYKGTAFHRVMEQFMVQGGDVVNGDGTGTFTAFDGPGGSFKDENLGALTHLRGALSMANSGPNTNGCQFFITVARAPWLDGRHQVFGRVLSGMKLIEAVSHTKVDSQYRPEKPVVIKAMGELQGPAAPEGASHSQGGAPAAPAPASGAADAGESSNEVGRRSRKGQQAAKPGPKVTQAVYFDIEQNGTLLGRVVLGLYGDVVPKTAENFVRLALGKTPGGVSYKGTKFHRVIEGFMVQGGDVVFGDGSGAFTAWDGMSGRFRDENLGAFTHEKGALAMANYGPDTNSCQFFIVTADSPELDGKYQVFGRVLKGMDLVTAISEIDADEGNAPLVPVYIRAAGELPLKFNADNELVV